MLQSLKPYCSAIPPSFDAKLFKIALVASFRGTPRGGVWRIETPPF